MHSALALLILLVLQPRDAARADLIARDRALVDAFLKNDRAAIFDLYARDAIVMPPNAPAITGHAEILPWAEQISAVLVSFAASPIQVRVAGHHGWVAGSYTMTVRLSDGTTVDDKGKYLEVWQRREGRWRIVADMFNTDLPSR